MFSEKCATSVPRKYKNRGDVQRTPADPPPSLLCFSLHDTERVREVLEVIRATITAAVEVAWGDKREGGQNKENSRLVVP